MKHLTFGGSLFAGLFFVLTAPLAASPPPLEKSIADLLAVGPEGKGNPEAAAAMTALESAGIEALPRLLAALNRANPLATNYLRGAIDALVGRETAQGNTIPLTVLSETLLDPQHGEQARIIAFELVEDTAPATAERLIPGFLADPANALRRKAVALLLEDAAKLPASESGSAALLYRQALGAARDVDQVQAAAQALARFDHPVDLPRQFGFLMHWSIIGPFDNTGREGFATVYPPESGRDPEAVYPGKESAEVRWQPYVTSDPYGKVNFNDPLGMLKEVVAYAHTEFHSEFDQTAEIRLGTKNAWKVWLNGELLFGRDEYHRGQRIDQYRLPIHLRAGRNDILVKACQNEQEQDWTVQWEFQLRVCDETGAAILSTERPPTPQAEAPSRRPRPQN